MAQERKPRSPTDLGPLGRRVLGVYLAVVSLFLIYFLTRIWPTQEADAAGKIPPATISLFWGWINFKLHSEVQMILLVVAAAGLGSYVHMATSFSEFVGNQKIYRSWVWWYILRLPVGAALALVFYFLIRGGILSTGVSSTEMSAFGVAGLSGLIGMFSKQAIDKLNDLFDTLFKKATSDQREDKLV